MAQVRAQGAATEVKALFAVRGRIDRFKRGEPARWARPMEAQIRSSSLRQDREGPGDASAGLPFSFSMTKVSISLLPDTEQASWGVWGDVSSESPALRV